MQQNMKYKLTAIMVGLSLLASTNTYLKEAKADVSFIPIDLSQPPSQGENDFPFGIECDDPDFVYVTIHKQGLLARINKDTHAVELINDPEIDPETGLPPAGGQNFYSVERDPNTGNLFINELFNGKLWRFESSAPSETAWTRVPIVEEVKDTLADGTNNITYDDPATEFIETYDFRPTHLRVNGNFYPFSTFNVGEVVFANGNIWVALSYFFDFDPVDEEDTGGDRSFVGLVRVNPSSLAVTRVAIPGADPFVNAPAGLSVDITNPNIIWITDLGADKIYRVDTSLIPPEIPDLSPIPPEALQTIDNTVISDPVIDAPRGIDDDDTNIYVALNKPGPGTSEIAKINKLTLDAEIIDTGAPIDEFDGKGTFTVFVNGGLLVWTDQAFLFDPITEKLMAHVGIIDLTTTPPTVLPFETTPETGSNHFGCVPFDGQFWFAGQGSAKVGILPNSKFSGGRPVRATGGGGGGLYRGRDFAFGNPDDPRYDANAPNIEEVLIQEGSIKILAKITDTVGVKDATIILGKIPFPMSQYAGGQSWWYRVFTSDDLPVSGDTILAKIVARDYNNNTAEHSVTLEIPFGAFSFTYEGSSFLVTPLPVVGHQADQAYSIVASNVRTNEQDISPQITIKNTSNEPLQNIRLMLSPELKGKFLLSDYAIKSIAPNSEFTVSLKLNGKQNVDAMNNPIPYGGQVIISVDNRTPYILEISGNVPNESASLQSLFMKMIADKSNQRYKSFEKPDLRISQDAAYQVTLGSGEHIIKSVFDELIITNNGAEPLKNLRIMTSALSDHFLPDQKNIELLPAGSFVRVKLVPKIDDALASGDIKGELLVVPENGNPVMVPINIGKKLAEDRNSMYEVDTLSGSDAISNTADGMVIRNNSKEPVENVRVILSQELARVFSISEDSFKSIEPNSQKTVYLQQRGTTDSNVRQILNDYRGEIIIVSSDGMKKTIPVNVVWKGISSEHFVVYARDNAQELTKAAQVINFLERSYPKVTQVIDEVETRTVIYMTSSLEEIKMLSDALAPSTYVYDKDIGFVWSNSEDVNMLALKEFAYRTIMQNYGTYWAKQKITLDKGNWLVDGIASYATASIVGERGMINEQLDALIAEPAPFEWYGASAPSQHGASYTLFKFLAEKYGDTIIDKILNNLGATMVSNNRCETMEQCALLKAVYDANGWNMNDKRYDMSFATITEEWKGYVEEKYSIIMN